MFRVAAEPGTFRTEEYQGPISTVLSTNGSVTVGGFPAASPVGSGALNAPGQAAQSQEFDRVEQFAKLQSNDDKEKKDATQALLDNFKSKSMAGRVTGIVPVNIDFPAFGPSIYVVSELTSENQFPAAEFSFQRDKKGGAR
jgi:hypothetical protein